MGGHPENGAIALGELRSIEIDLADLGLPADFHTPDDLAAAQAHVYERFVAYADDGWEWLVYPGSRAFDGWLSGERGGRRILTGVRLLSRRATDEAGRAARPSHGVSAFRTRQLTGRPWSAEPGSKHWRSFSHRT